MLCRNVIIFGEHIVILKQANGQDMKILMTESQMYLLDIKSSPSLTGQNSRQKYAYYQFGVVDKNNLEEGY